MSESFGRGESALFLQNPELAAAARRQRLAEELFGQAVKPRNVGGHAGGLAQMGQALIAGYMGYKEDERIRGIADAQRAREEEEVRALMGGGMPAAAPEGQAPAAESALATPPGSLPPPIPLGAEAPPMAQALMNPPGQPGQGGAAPGMPLPPPVPAGGAAQPGGLPSMDQIMAGMASRSPRVQAVAQMLFQQARRQEDLALRAQDRAEDRAFRLANRAPPALTELEKLFQEANLPPGAPERVQAARDMIARRGLPPSTNINMPSPESALMKADTETMKLVNEGAQQARAMVNMFTRAEEAVRQVPEGTGAQLLPIVGQTARALGVDIQGTSEAEVLNSLRNQLASLQRVPGSGATSDRDMALYLQAVPRLGNTREGNLKLIDMGRRLMERRIQEAGVWRRNIGQPDIMEKLDELGPVFSAQERQILQQDAMPLRDQTGGGVQNPRGDFSAAPPGRQQPIRVETPEQARRLPSGTPILLPDGTMGRVP